MLIGLETSLHFSYQISLAFQHWDSIVWGKNTMWKEGITGKKCFTHMEGHFLRLVLALLPEGVLAVVGHNFVLETGIENEII